MLTPAPGASYSNPKESPAGRWFSGLGLNIRGSNENAILSRMLAAALMPQMAQSLQLGDQLQSKLPGLAMQFDPGSRQHLIARGENQAFSGASRASRQAEVANRGAGLGSGYRAGQTNAAFNAAASRGNELFRLYNSPEFVQQVAQMYQAMSQPANANLFAALVGGQPYQQRQQQQDNFLPSLMQALGMYAGAR